MLSHMQHTATHCNTLQHTETHCNTLQHTATHCNTLQHIATHCNTLQHTATHCNTLQHTATRCALRHKNTQPQCALWDMHKHTPYTSYIDTYYTHAIYKGRGRHLGADVLCVSERSCSAQMTVSVPAHILCACFCSIYIMFIFILVKWMCLCGWLVACSCYLSAKEPHLSAKKPYLSAKYPISSAKKPYFCAKDSYLSAKIILFYGAGATTHTWLSSVCNCACACKRVRV